MEKFTKNVDSCLDSANTSISDNSDDPDILPDNIFEEKDIPAEPRYEDDPENYNFYHTEWSMKYGPSKEYHPFKSSNIDSW